MQSSPSSRSIKTLGWILAGLIIILLATGVTLSIVSGSAFVGTPVWINALEAIGLSGMAIVGALIISRHPEHPVGWLWLAIAVSFGLDTFAWGYAYYATILNPGSLPGAQAAILWLYLPGRGTFGFSALALLLLLFPTGKPISRFFKAVAWIAVVRTVLAVLLAFLAPAPLGDFPFAVDLLPIGDRFRAVALPLSNLLTVIGILCVLAGAVSLFIRLKRSRGVERQQLKWFFFAAAFLPLAFLLIFAGFQLGSGMVNPISLAGAILGVTVTLFMAAASAIAIVRYRLWDIDLIIHRTLIYGTLTFCLGLLYLGGVIGLQRLFGALTGNQDSTLAIVLSTLAIAALFNPLRRRIQDVIDRAFYRRKYDAEKVIKTFAAAVRDEVELEAIEAHLLRAVNETMQPDRLALTLMEPIKSQSAGLRRSLEED